MTDPFLIYMLLGYLTALMVDHHSRLTYDQRFSDASPWYAVLVLFFWPGLWIMFLGGQAVHTIHLLMHTAKLRSYRRDLDTFFARMKNSNEE